MSESTAEYRERVAAHHLELGIPPGYMEATQLPLQREATELMEDEPDLFGRQPRLTPVAWQWWRRMRDAASEEGITIHIVSAFRSVEYQVEVIRNKLAEGRTIEDILTVNAAPGYSEHHTGRAVDLTTDGCEPLSEEFAETAAFGWLQTHAERFHFFLSYPRDNPFGIAYEPWHWICRQH